MSPLHLTLTLKPAYTLVRILGGQESLNKAADLMVKEAGLDLGDRSLSDGTKTGNALASVPRLLP